MTAAASTPTETVVRGSVAGQPGRGVLVLTSGNEVTVDMVAPFVRRRCPVHAHHVHERPRRIRQRSRHFVGTSRPAEQQCRSEPVFSGTNQR